MVKYNYTVIKSSAFYSKYGTFKQQAAREMRKRNILNTIDQIVEGKLRKMRKKCGSKEPSENASEDEDGEAAVTKEKVSEELFKDINDLPRSKMLVQTFLRPPPWRRREEKGDRQVQDAAVGEGCRVLAGVRRATYADLWRRGFTLTSGARFGGDFLAYPGDPIRC